MSCTARGTLAEAYDPDPWAMATAATGSLFLLVSLLSNPSSNPPYLLGLVMAVLSLVVSIVVLAAEARR